MKLKYWEVSKLIKSRALAWILKKCIAFRARIIRLLLCIILYYMHYDSFQMQDGAILALCILTLVTAVILLVDFIIMARFLFPSMWSFRIKHLSFSRSVRNRRWKAPSVVQIFQCKVFQRTISESSLLPKYLISTEHNFRTN